jgi:hypothetical protein
VETEEIVGFQQWPWIPCYLSCNCYICYSFWVKVILIQFLCTIFVIEVTCWHHHQWCGMKNTVGISLYFICIIFNLVTISQAIQHEEMPHVRNSVTGSFSVTSLFLVFCLVTGWWSPRDGVMNHRNSHVRVFENPNEMGLRLISNTDFCKHLLQYYWEKIDLLDYSYFEHCLTAEIPKFPWTLHAGTAGRCVRQL